MLIIGDYMISISLYFTIGIVISILLFLYYMFDDFRNNDLSLLGEISNMGEGFCIGLSWIISIPILVITYIIKAIIIIIYFDFYY